MSNDASAHITLDRFWPYHSIVLADHVSRYTLSVVRKEAGLNLSQWRVLAAVADKPGRTAAEVTAITPMDKTIVSRAVSSLIEQKMIKKTENAADKRRLSLTTTVQGAKVYSQIAEILSDAMVKSLGSQDAAKDLIKALKAFTAHIDRISQPPN